MNNLRRLLFVATFLMITFVAKQVLAGVPNIQAVSLLTALFFVNSNWKEATMFLIGYVLLDFIVWGYPTLMIPSFLSWAFWGLLVKNSKENEYIMSSFVLLFTVAHMLFYMIHDLFFFSLRVESIPAYLIAGIPFAIPMFFSGFLSILLLFKPLNRILGHIKN